MMRSAVLTVAALGTIALAACNNDTVTGPGFTCDITNPVQSIVIAPAAGARIVVHTPALDSDTAKVVAVATSRFGATRTDVVIGFSSSDTTVATVDAAGVIHARKPGTATIKAAACGESASTVVTVVANIARVTLSPASDTVLTGDSIVYTAHALSAGGLLVPAVFTFSASPSSAVTLHQTSDSTVTVTGAAAGSATITATAEGASAGASALVLPRIFLAGTALSSTIDAGDATGCGIISLGHTYCWGLNNHGQIGVNVDSTCFAGVDPGTVVNDTTTKSTALPCSLIPARISPDVDFTSISAGDSTSCGISTTGRVYCFGFGFQGQVGDGLTIDQAKPILINTALTFSSISVGGEHACAIATGGTAYCWGDDSFGQLGDARRVNSTTPIPVSGGGAPASFAMISAGFRHTCAVASDGTGFCWGNNDQGQLGNGSNTPSDTPVQVAGGLRFQSISAGGDHTCGILTSGAAVCWGSNADGQLGIGSTGGGSPVPVSVIGGVSFTRISASTGTRALNQKALPFKALGFGHTCALSTAGAIFCWGDDTDLQLGRGQFTGSGTASGVPTQVATGERTPSATFTSVSTGSRHSCAVATDGNAYCWGSNVMGSLGNTLQAAFRGQPQKVATPK